jgi:cell wall-associated NlpC family hydrolase
VLASGDGWPIELWRVQLGSGDHRREVVVMVADDVVVLARAHELFAGSPGAPGSAAGVAGSAERGLGSGERLTGATFDRYRERLASGRVDLRAAGGTDERLVGILRGAVADHGATQQATRVILDAARNDAAPAADTPMGQRELMRRKAARLRAQHRTVASARTRALRRRALIRALRYGRGRVDPRLLAGLSDAPNPRAAAAVRAALSQLGKPYVWGATGPNAFDCSGLTQWAYRQAGVDISRTTFTQIHDGPAVPRSMVAPGDLVFPNRGHVVMYIGNGQVVEAPSAGQNVKVSPMPAGGQIRRPLG